MALLKSYLVGKISYVTISLRTLKETLRVFAYQIKGYLKVVNTIKDYYDLNSYVILKIFRMYSFLVLKWLRVLDTVLQALW